MDELLFMYGGRVRCLERVSIPREACMSMIDGTNQANPTVYLAQTCYCTWRFRSKQTVLFRRDLASLVRLRDRGERRHMHSGGLGGLRWYEEECLDGNHEPSQYGRRAVLLMLCA